MKNPMKNMTNKLSILLGLTILLSLSGCDGPFKKGPSAKDVQKAWFKDEISHVKVKKWECRFVDDPEAAKSNRYLALCDVEYAYTEPLYHSYGLSSSPREHPEIGQLTIWNRALKAAGKKGFSPVLIQNYEKDHVINGQFSVEMRKVDGKWEIGSVFEKSGTFLGAGEMKYVWGDRYVVYGSPEHIKELHDNGYELPNKDNLKSAEEIYAEQFNRRIKAKQYVPKHFDII